MSILKNLQKAHTAVVVDTLRGGHLGKDIGTAAIRAIDGGLGSPVRAAYMALFANNATELERLTTPKPGEENYLPQFRAYILANAVCDASTNTFTNNRIDERIDAGFTPADMVTDPQFIQARIIQIPDFSV